MVRQARRRRRRKILVGLFNLAGNLLTSSQPSSTNFAAWWDADLLRELEDGTSVTKYNFSNGTTSTLLSCSSCASNNGTKSDPVLLGDIFGDWREEVVWRTSDNLHLRIYTTTTPATNRMYTMLQDPEYRLALVWQNVAYNQPPWPSFYIGPGMTAPPQPSLSYPVNLSGSITGKSGSQGARVWTIQVNNTGTAPANTAQIQGLSLVQTSGTACTPTVTIPTFPVNLGNIAAGGLASSNITINFNSCSGSPQFTVNVPLSAMGDGAMALFTATGQTQ